MTIGYMKELRQRLGLEEDDISKDDDIKSMDSMDRVRMLCGWELGDTSWCDVFLGWMRSQGLNVDALYISEGMEVSDERL